MNKSFINLIRTAAMMAGIAVFLAGKNSGAATHTVEFGGSLGFAYSPSNFSAAVGDTVKWTGDFTMHPLSSTTIPADAASWHGATGTSFSYVIKVPGTYHYQCDFHVSAGMTGSFEAQALSALDDPFISLGQKAAVADIATIVRHGKPLIKLDLPSTQIVTLQIFDLRGNIVSTLFNRMVEAGTHLVAIDNRFQTNGLFIIRLSGKGSHSSRTFHFIE
jgi:plastocyanin